MLAPIIASKSFDALKVSYYTANPMNTFERIVDHFGGTHESLARALGCSRAAVTMWDGQFPVNRAYQIQVLSAGRFKVDKMPLRLPPIGTGKGRKRVSKKNVDLSGK